MPAHTLYAFQCLGFSSLYSEGELRALLRSLAGLSTVGDEETLRAEPFPGCHIFIQLDLSGEPRQVKVSLHTPPQAIIPFGVSPLNEGETAVLAFACFGNGVGEAFSFVGTGPWAQAEMGKVAFGRMSAFARSIQACEGEAEEAGLGEPTSSLLTPLRGVVLDVQHLENRLASVPVTLLEIWVPGLRVPLVCPGEVSPEVGTLVTAQTLLAGELFED